MEFFLQSLDRHHQAIGAIYNLGLIWAVPAPWRPLSPSTRRLIQQFDVATVEPRPLEPGRAEYDIGRDTLTCEKLRTSLVFNSRSRKISFNKDTSVFKLGTHLAITKAKMSRPLQAPPSDHVEVDHIIEEIESDMDVPRVGLNFSYEYLST